MKLKRKWARIDLVCLGTALVLVLLLGLTGEVAFAVLTVLALLVSLLIRLGALRCPSCGKTIAPSRWNKGKRFYSSCCGTPFVFDDEPDDPQE